MEVQIKFKHMKPIKILLCLSLITFLLPTAYSQQDSPVTPDSSSMDFWVGDWALIWDDGDGKTGQGTNRIERVLGGMVIQENFEAKQGKIAGYVGKSWSVYNKRTGEWKQTWVDNQGAYLDFEYQQDGEKKMFARSFIGPAGKTVQQRMVFRDIQENSFTWDWESSTDLGETWKLQWQIKYVRN
jgi:hypothetical protein